MDIGFEIVVAVGDFRRGDPVRIYSQDRGGFRAAAAIVELEKGVKLAVGSSPSGLLTSEDAHGEHGPALGISRNIGGERGHVTHRSDSLLRDGEGGQDGSNDQKHHGAHAVRVHNASEEMHCTRIGT